MKLIIQIPCYNEEETLLITLNDLPKKIEGIDKLEYQIINDGSTDNTSNVAKEWGVHHIVESKVNQGLAIAFMKGVHHALKNGADIIVNTDADNQYCASDIPKLIQPILDGYSDIVIGERPIDETEHFSPTKKKLQRFGSMIVRFFSNTNIVDAPSGFRAISRDAAIKLNVFNRYTYTLEMIIQAGQNGLNISSIPINTNEDLRPSRLMNSQIQYINRSMLTILRMSMVYSPFKFFILSGSLFIFLAFILFVRWSYFYLSGDPGSHTPSIVVASLFTMCGFGLWGLGAITDLLAINRKILEDIQQSLRKELYDK